MFLPLPTRGRGEAACSLPSIFSLLLPGTLKQISWAPLSPARPSWAVGFSEQHPGLLDKERTEPTRSFAPPLPPGGSSAGRGASPLPPPSRASLQTMGGLTPSGRPAVIKTEPPQLAELQSAQLGWPWTWGYSSAIPGRVGSFAAYFFSRETGTWLRPTNLSWLGTLEEMLFSFALLQIFTEILGLSMWW